MEAAESRAASVDVHQTTQNNYPHNNVTNTFIKTIKNLGFASKAHVSHQKRQYKQQLFRRPKERTPV